MNALCTWAAVLDLHQPKLADASQLWSGSWVAALDVELKDTGEKLGFLTQHVLKCLQNGHTADVQQALSSLPADAGQDGHLALISLLSVSLLLLWEILPFYF